MKTTIISKAEAAAATTERKRRSALAKKCRCGNQATFGYDTCGGCRERAEAREQSVQLLKRAYDATTIKELHAVVIELAERILS